MIPIINGESNWKSTLIYTIDSLCIASSSLSSICMIEEREVEGIHKHSSYTYCMHAVKV